jgi:hypothetical protein
MAQHFLLSARARTLSLKAIYQAGDDEWSAPPRVDRIRLLI